MTTTVDMPIALPGRLARLRTFVRRNPTIAIGSVLLVAMAVVAAIAPWIAGDPQFMIPTDRLRPPSLVPGSGLRKLIGTMSGSMKRICSANSTRWSLVSPMPTMPPEHSSMPTSPTSRQVSWRSSQVWVLQMDGK